MVQSTMFIQNAYKEKYVIIARNTMSEATIKYSQLENTIL